MKRDRRKYSRIDLTLLAKITFHNNPNTLFLGKNISLSGVFIPTHLRIDTGEYCFIKLNFKQPDELINRKILSKVVRNNNSGFGVQFIRMDYETHMMLQTRLLYSCNDPSTLCEEFSSSCPITIKEPSGSFNLSATDITI